MDINGREERMEKKLEDMQDALAREGNMNRAPSE
jgi:hypothetical protein